MLGAFTGVGHPFWLSPPGYAPSAQRRSWVERANGLAPKGAMLPFEAGSPVSLAYTPQEQLSPQPQARA